MLRQPTLLRVIVKRDYTPQLARHDIRSSASNRAKRIKRLDIERVEVVQPQVEVPRSASTAWGILINSAAKLGRPDATGARPPPASRRQRAYHVW